MGRATAIIVAPALILLAVCLILATGGRDEPIHAPAQGWMLWPGAALIVGAATYSRTRDPVPWVPIALVAVALAAIGAALDYRDPARPWLLLVLPLGLTFVGGLVVMWEMSRGDPAPRRVLTLVGMLALGVGLSWWALSDAL